MITSHFRVQTPRKRGGTGKVKFPLLSDKSQEISKNYGVFIWEKGYSMRFVRSVHLGEGLLDEVVRSVHLGEGLLNEVCTECSSGRRATQ